MGVIPDRPFLYEKLTAGEFLRFVGSVYRMPDFAIEGGIDRYLELFRLTEWKNDLIENFSHGMKQRLVMAAALLHEPEVLVVDEPMVGLDPKGARLVKEIFIRQAKEKGVSIFMSTHSLEVAQQVCDRIAILQHGRVIATGTPEELRKEAGSEDSDLESIFLILTGDEDTKEIAKALGA